MKPRTPDKKTTTGLEDCNSRGSAPWPCAEEAPSRRAWPPPPSSAFHTCTSPGLAPPCGWQALQTHAQDSFLSAGGAQARAVPGQPAQLLFTALWLSIPHQVAKSSKLQT